MDGEIIFHGTNDYPHNREERTLEEQKLMTKVKERAKYAAQQEFPEKDIVDPEWNPDEVDRAMQAIQGMHVDAFAEQFRTYYEMVTAPESFDGVPAGSAQVVFQPFFINDHNEVVSVPRPLLQYKQHGEVKTAEGDPNLLENNPGTKFSMILPPMEFDEGDYEFPDGFQVICIEHLAAQMRDLYRNMGEEPPDVIDYDPEFPGRPRTAADDELYEDF